MLIFTWNIYSLKELAEAIDKYGFPDIVTFKGKQKRLKGFARGKKGLAVQWVKE